MGELLIADRGKIKFDINNLNIKGIMKFRETISLKGKFMVYELLKDSGGLFLSGFIN